MDIGRCFKDAWNLLMKDLAPLAVTAVIAAVAIGVAALIMALIVGDSFSTSFNGDQLQVNDVSWGAVVLAWLIVAVVAVVVGAWEYGTLLKIMLRRVREDRAAGMDDLRLGLDGMGAFIVALIVLGVLIGLGFVVFIIPGVIMMTIWAYVLVLIADKGRGLGEAMSDSAALAKKPGYVMTFVTLLVGGIAVGVVSGILGIIPVIGQILGLFVGVYLMAYVVAMYFQATGETALLDRALYGTPLPAGEAAGTAAYPPAPAAPTGGGAYPPAPSEPMAAAPVPPPAAPAPSAAPPEPATAAPEPPAPAPPAPEPPAPEPSAPAAAPEAPATPDVWAAAADPLATPSAGSEPAASEPPSTSASPPADEEETAGESDETPSA